MAFDRIKNLKNFDRRKAWESTKKFCSDNKKIFALMLVYFTFFLLVSMIMLMKSDAETDVGTSMK